MTCKNVFEAKTTLTGHDSLFYFFFKFYFIFRLYITVLVLPNIKMNPPQVYGAGALGRPRGMEWGGRREEGSGWGTHVYLWQIHFDIWQN